LQGNLSDGRRPILDQKQLCGLSQLLAHRDSWMHRKISRYRSTADIDQAAPIKLD
jgi:hypothetical protein